MDEERRGALIPLVVRPLLLVFWSLVTWGTLYGLVLIHAAATEGPGPALRRIVAGRDLLGGLVNLALAGGAALVWLGIGVAVWWTRRSDRKRHGTGGHAVRRAHEAVAQGDEADETG